MIDLENNPLFLLRKFENALNDWINSFTNLIVEKDKNMFIQPIDASIKNSNSVKMHPQLLEILPIDRDAFILCPFCRSCLKIDRLTILCPNKTHIIFRILQWQQIFCDIWISTLPPAAIISNITFKEHINDQPIIKIYQSAKEIYNDQYDNNFFDWSDQQSIISKLNLLISFA